MPVTVLIPTALGEYVGRREAVEVLGTTVGEVVANLGVQYPDLGRHLLAADGRLRSFVNLFINDQDVRGLQRDATPVRESDVLAIIPSLAGGSLVMDRAEEVELSNDEVARYSRHLIMPEGGTAGDRERTR